MSVGIKDLAREVDDKLDALVEAVATYVSEAARLGAEHSHAATEAAEQALGQRDSKGRIALPEGRGLNHSGKSHPLYGRASDHVRAAVASRVQLAKLLGLPVASPAKRIAELY